MQFEVNLSEKKTKIGIIESIGLEVPDELDDLTTLIEAMRKQEPKYKDALVYEVTQAIGRGELRHVKPIGNESGCNQITQLYWATEAAFQKGTATDLQALAFKYFAVGTRFTQQPDPLTKLGIELARVVPSYVQYDGSSNTYTSSYFNKSVGNPTGNTTATGGTTTTIILTSATGFAIGNRIQLQTVNAIYTATVTNLVGLTLTVNDIQGGGLLHANAFNASDLPSAGNYVTVLHCEAGLFMGSSASSLADTGTIANWRPFEFSKVRPPTPLGVSVIYNVIFLNIALP